MYRTPTVAVIAILIAVPLSGCSVGPLQPSIEEPSRGTTAGPESNATEKVADEPGFQIPIIPEGMSATYQSGSSDRRVQFDYHGGEVDIEVKTWAGKAWSGSIQFNETHIRLDLSDRNGDGQYRYHAPIGDLLVLLIDARMEESRFGVTESHWFDLAALAFVPLAGKSVPLGVNQSVDLGPITFSVYEQNETQTILVGAYTHVRTGEQRYLRAWFADDDPVPYRLMTQMTEIASRTGTTSILDDLVTPAHQSTDLRTRYVLDGAKRSCQDIRSGGTLPYFSEDVFDIARPEVLDLLENSDEHAAFLDETDTPFLSAAHFTRTADATDSLHASQWRFHWSAPQEEAHRYDTYTATFRHTEPDQAVRLVDEDRGASSYVWLTGGGPDKIADLDAIVRTVIDDPQGQVFSLNLDATNPPTYYHGMKIAIREGSGSPFTEWTFEAAGGCSVATNVYQDSSGF